MNPQQRRARFPTASPGKAGGRPVVVSVLALVVALLAGCGPGGEEPPGPGLPPPPTVGVVVEKLPPGIDADQAVLQVGDRLIAWSRPRGPEDGAAGGQLTGGEPAGGPIRTPFDLLFAQVAQAPRGGVVVRGWRDGEPFAIEPPEREWELQKHPALDPAEQEHYDQALELSRQDDSTGAAKILVEMADQRRQAGMLQGSAWLDLMASTAWASDHRWEEAEAAAQRARDDLDGPGDLWALSWVEETVASWRTRQQNHQGAIEAIHRATELRRQVPDAALGVARALEKAGELEYRRRRLDAAEEAYRGALELVQRWAPGSLREARATNQLGKIYAIRGDLVAAEEYFRTSLAVRQELAPGTLQEGHSLNSLGTVLSLQGDLTGSQEALEQALELFSEQLPGSSAHNTVLHNLGLLATERGDLVTGEEYYRQALESSERHDPGGMSTTVTLNNLGTLARRRGDLAAAEDYHRRALAIRRKIAPGGLDEATSLLNLASLAMDREQLDAAWELLQDAHAIHRREVPDTAQEARALTHLCHAAWRRGQLTEAREHCQRALEIFRERTPGSLDHAKCLHHRGRVALLQGELRRAEQTLRDGLEILDQLAPGTDDQARSLQTLAEILIAAGREEEAAEVLERATEALDAQRGKIGGSDQQQALYGAKALEVYRRRVDLALRNGDTSAALDALERSRARVLLSLLAQRELVFSADLSSELDRRRRQLAVEYDRAQEELAGLSAKADPERVATVLERLRGLRQQQDEVRAEIRRASPRLASLQDPQPLDAAAARRALDPGTVALYYSLGEESGWLLVVTRDAEPRAIPLAVSEAELRAKVQRWLLVLEAPGTGLTAVRALGTELYDLLVAPAEPEIAAGERILVIPDGPLHGFPFGALVSSEEPVSSSDAATNAPAARSPDSSPTVPPYLAAWRPLHSALSLTLYHQLALSHQLAEEQEEGPDGEVRIAAALFGDPLFGGSAEAGNEDQAPAEGPLSEVRRGAALAPLPTSRLEVETIAELLGQEARVFVGEEATEVAARNAGDNVRYLHFATHAVMDERFPLDSALVLSRPDEVRPGEDNGLLQAWEIFEGVRVDAELVTLSACRSGLGREIAGEGMVGLTRAFQFAGAPAVVSASWSVPDRSTAALMARFYARLEAGESKDEALRGAQMELAAGPVDLPRGPTPGPGWLWEPIRSLFWSRPPAETVDASHPYYWAGFQLTGRWK
ncbi:MAG: CHAT domain-containing protein [Acidobacteriota bacterium]|nr:CHAT domain-containing protein [Acidobacteriota bacterium]